MLGANSRIKGEKDFAKYEKARELKGCIKKIRADYEVTFCFLALCYREISARFGK